MLRARDATLDVPCSQAPSFGLGLVSGMANPAKVLGFLDLAGPWDPSLSLAMVGAIAVGAIAFGIAARRSVSLLGLPMNLPTSRTLDARFVAGSLLFGIGWGPPASTGDWRSWRSRFTPLWGSGFRCWEAPGPTFPSVDEVIREPDQHAPTHQVARGH